MWRSLTAKSDLRFYFQGRIGGRACPDIARESSQNRPLSHAKLGFVTSSELKPGLKAAARLGTWRQDTGPIHQTPKAVSKTPKPSDETSKPDEKNPQQTPAPPTEQTTRLLGCFCDFSWNRAAPCVE